MANHRPARDVRALGERAEDVRAGPAATTVADHEPSKRAAVLIARNALGRREHAIIPVVCRPSIHGAAERHAEA